MSAIAVLLIAIGCADLVRPLTSGRRWVATLLAPILVVGAAALCGLWHPGDFLVIGVAAVVAAGWELTCTAAEQWSGARQATPLLVFPGLLLPLLALSGFASPIGGAVRAWWSWAGHATGISPSRMLMVAGVVLMQMATGNQMVRWLLKSVGAM